MPTMLGSAALSAGSALSAPFGQLTNIASHAVYVQGVPSGILIAVSGTISAIQSGTYTTSPTGTQTVIQAATSSVTIVPSGTQTVTGTVTLSSQTVTAVQSGTYTTAPTGTQTTAPTGTQTVAYGSGTFVTSDLADGSVAAGTAGSKSILIGGQFNTSAPSLTNAQQVALQVDSSGRLIIVPTVTAVQSGTYTTAPTGTQTVIPASSSTVTVVQATGTNLHAVLDSQPTTTDKTQSTGLTAAGTVAVSTNGCGTAYLTLTGTGAGMSFTIQGEDSNGNWNNISALTLAGAIVSAGTTLSANGQWLVPCAGFQAVRANLTAITSGTATFNWEAGSGTQVVAIINPITGTVTNVPSGTQTIVGNVASGSADSGNPVKIGAIGHTANPTAVTDGQRVDLIADKVGRIVVTHMQVRDLKVNSRTSVANTTETTVLSAVAATFLDLTQIIITNTDTKKDANVDFRDSTGGTIRVTVHAPALATVVVTFADILTQATVNNNWTATSDTAVQLFITVLAIKNI